MFLNIKSKIMKQAQKYRQLSLFDNFAEGGGKSLEPFETPEEEQTSKRLKGGSQNPIVFHDYESYVAKFKDGPKTTDDKTMGEIVANITPTADVIKVIRTIYNFKAAEVQPWEKESRLFFRIK